MTREEELTRVARRFGADRTQVERDYLISHVLASLSAFVSMEDLVFFGGTALSRTFLPDGRLSEDIDLIALGPRARVAEAVTAAVRQGVQRTHGRPQWDPPLVAVAGSQPSVLSVPTGASIRVQLLDGTGYRWPTEVRDLEQRYADVPFARLRTLTASAFAAAKLSAWVDRGASRDLWDLARLADGGFIDESAASLFLAYGPFASPPGDWVFASAPSDAQWRQDLAHQTVLDLTPEEAKARAAAAWRCAFRA